MGRKTRALLWSLAWLAAAEAGVRVAEQHRPSLGRLAMDERLVLMLGTSRTLHGIEPGVVQEELAELGVGDVFAANATRVAATNIGLLQTWVDEVLPPARSHGRGVVAIELRVEGFNDAYLAEGEDLGGRAAELGIEDEGVAELLAHGRLEDTSWWLLSRLHLSGLPDLLRRVVTAAGAEEESPDRVRRPRWARGDRGFLPAKGKPPAIEKIEDHYREKIFADFAYGGRQTRAIEALVASIRSVGMVPVLYLMPVTARHHALYPGDTWSRVLGHMTTLAAELDVPFVDLDAGHELPADLFHDTGHLRRAGADVVSARLARQVLLPLLR